MPPAFLTLTPNEQTAHRPRQHSAASHWPRADTLAARHMRLSPTELSAIRSTLGALDPLGRVYLFGSRADAWPVSYTHLTLPTSDLV